MEKFTPPGPLNFEGNIADKWKKWCREFAFFLAATESDAKSDKIKSSILTCICQRGRDIYNTLTLILSIFYISLDLSTIYFAHFSGC